VLWLTFLSNPLDAVMVRSGSNLSGFGFGDLPYWLHTSGLLAFALRGSGGSVGHIT
jgi:hypothetical protein